MEHSPLEARNGGKDASTQIFKKALFETGWLAPESSGLESRLGTALLPLLSTNSSFATDRHMIRLALRFDDPSATSDHALESAIFAEAERFAQSLTVAVVPFQKTAQGDIPLDAGNCGPLLDAHRCGIIEIAQHGCSHERMGSTPTGEPSEFFGLPQIQQLQRIQEGRKVLEALFGSKIKGFVPPWNTADTTTQTVLKELGFNYISGGQRDAPPPSAGILTLPRTCQLVEVTQKISAIRSFEWMQPILVAVLHHYDFIESGSEKARISLRDFAALLEWIAEQRYVTRVKLEEISIRHSGSLGTLRTLRGSLPWRFRRFLPEDCLVPVPNLLSFFH